MSGVSTAPGRVMLLALGLLLAANVAVLGVVLNRTAPGVETADAESAPQPTPTPVPGGAMWTVGTGGDGDNPYIEWVSIYPTSSLWNVLGAPSLRFIDHDPHTPDYDRSFEIGFYKYGPTWHSRNPIVEFWLGGPEHGGGSLSVIGNDNSGGQIEVRNPTDTGHITLDYRDANHPVISVDPSNPLALRAERGLISESMHTFLRGIRLAPESERIGQADGEWDAGAIWVASAGVEADSIILLTPTSPPRGAWWVADISPGEGFRVESTAPDEDMTFNWLILN